MRGPDAKNTGQTIGGREKHAGLGSQKHQQNKWFLIYFMAPKCKTPGKQTFFVNSLGAGSQIGHFPENKLTRLAS